MKPKRRTLSKRTYLNILHKQRMICACGCEERLVRGGIEFDHTLPLHLGGFDSLENLRAIRSECHKVKTKKESKSRAKIRRIQATGGMKKKRLNKKEKLMERLHKYKRMP